LSAKIGFAPPLQKYGIPEVGVSGGKLYKISHFQSPAEDREGCLGEAGIIT
jgi:hypothetical protein